MERLDTLSALATVVQTTTMPKASRTSTRPNTPLKDEDDIKYKARASRQTYSCAECKRLKLKCSRTWPCTSCTKRGCAQICPAGEMRTGKGKRLILADTEELHSRIAKLELALARSHANTTTEAHPLLSSAYLFAPRTPVETIAHKNGFQPELEENGQEVDGTFGTLTIGPDGHAVFVGSGAGSEFLHRDQTNMAPITPLKSAYIGSLQDTPNSAQSLDNPYGFMPPGESSSQSIERLRDSLPDWDAEGRTLCESYWDNVSWLFDVIPREVFDADHLPSVYTSSGLQQAHKLACVFFVMALGALFDLHRQSHDPRAEQLYRLGGACLTGSGLGRSSLATVQALLLQAQYALNSKDDNGAEVCWPILGSAVKCATSLGLHRDGEPFGLAEQEVIERRKVLWELVIQERLQALCFARPGSLSSRYIDTKRPGLESKLAPDVTAFHDAKFQIAGIIERVIEEQTRVGPGPYSAVLQLDEDLLLLQQGLPESLLPTTNVNMQPMERLLHPHLVIQRLVIRLLINVCRLYLHRPSFARALSERPEDPSGFKFSQSFIALYESATEMVNVYKQLIVYHPSLVARYSFLHFHTFSAAVCLAAIAIKAPRCAFAAPALHSMIVMTDLCIAAHETSRAKNGLPILLRLRLKANTTMAETMTNNRALRHDNGREDDLSHLAYNSKLRRVVQDSPQLSTASPGWSVVSEPASSRQYASSHSRNDSLHSMSSTSTSALSITPWFGQETSHAAIESSVIFGSLDAPFADELYLGATSSYAQPAMEHIYTPAEAGDQSLYGNVYDFDLGTFMMQLDPRQG